ncbi:hypothetical protein HS088_TW22G00738 [Tripterygium wilfordii]|uniref:Cupin type-1 domain-containing protein n=1 Tax=Tripterygium wilfordii TaxID=458696 RepID=A0A7J7BYW3_TRIWF|nr:vicilin Jug r 6.0101-like [Tripterygium wilfordii]KAF5727051.1 hypothetical protein HS088_TW22G00738 [Tripterygium wilfordii]
MGFRGKLCLAILVLSVVVLGALATKDPELETCKHECEQQHQYDKKQKQDCKEECERYSKEKKEREREREGHGGRGGDREDAEGIIEREDPQKKHLKQCQSQCERQAGQERALCRLRCAQKYGGKSEGRGDEDVSYKRQEEEEEERGSEQEERNPYVFEDEHFSSVHKTEHGRIDVLQRFNKRSKLLKGIENYRFVVLEANPQTFITPCHLDAEAVLFVAKGRATVSMIQEDKREGQIKRESHNVECGDIIRIPAGTPAYITNTDNNEKLTIVKLLMPVNTPGHFEVFHGLGGDNPESFYRAFSREVLEAAFNTDWNKIERVFRQQSKGAIVKASSQQIQGLKHREEGGSIWPFEKESKGSFNLFKQRPSTCNNYGQLFEASPRDYRQLEDLDVTVSFANITRGSMAGPYFNSKSTKISFVVDGEGRFEMACPHVSSSGSSERDRSKSSSRGGQKGSTSYQRVSARLRAGTVFVVPAGHPITSIASANSNLRILCFELNTEGNTRYFLAGKNNVVSEMEKEAKELGFNVPAGEVERVFQRQDKELFYPGPESREEEERRASA